MVAGMHEFKTVIRDQAHQSGEERNEVASKAIELRVEYFAQKHELSEEARLLTEKINKIQEEWEIARVKLELLEEKYEKHVGGIFHKTLNVFVADPFEARIISNSDALKTIMSVAEFELGNLFSQLRIVEDQLANQNNLKQARSLVENFYSEKTKNFLTLKQKEEFFTAEKLEKLSTEELMELWRAGSPYYLSHVTRFGFRDHNAMIYHSGGMGKFHEGGLNMMSDKRVRPPIYLDGLKDIEPDTIKAYLEKYQVFDKPNQEEAFKYFKSLMEWSLASAPKYPDKTAVHFGAQRVLDAYYGCEADNEIFCVFPADFIASQTNFAFNGWQKTFTSCQSEDKWNDVFAWTGDREGISLDAGLVFLPAKTLVDPETGSRYASTEVKDETGKMVRDRIKSSESQKNLLTWWEKEKPNLEVLYQQIKSTQEFYSKRDLQNNFESIIKAGLLSLGANRVSYEATYIIQQYFYGDIDFTQNQDDIDEILNSSGLLFEKPKSPVEAQVYWEKYFAEHPENKPKHVVYYHGDPSQAVRDFMADHNVTPKIGHDDPDLLGFDKNHILDMEDNPKTNLGKNEIYAIAQKLIAEHYAQVPIEEPGLA